MYRVAGLRRYRAIQTRRFVRTGNPTLQWWTVPALTIFPCYAPCDRDIARELARFLTSGADVEVFLEDGVLREGESVITRAADGLSADLMLIFLSPESAPSRWLLSEWRAAFWDLPAEAGVPVAFVLLRECRFPELLSRRTFFDLRDDVKGGFRAIKRWILSLRPPAAEPFFEPARQPHFRGRENEFAALREMLADASGQAVVLVGPEGSGKTSLALEFASRFREEFAAILWLGVGDRSLTALVGDLAFQFGLKALGDTEENLQLCADFASRHRCLIVLDDFRGRNARLLFGGLSSILLTSQGPVADLPVTTLRIEPMDRSSTTLENVDEVVRQLGAVEQCLLEALCLCPPAGSRLSLVARIAGIDPARALEAVGALASAGLVLMLNENGARCQVASEVRRRIAENQSPQRMVLAVARQFTGRSWGHRDPEIDLSDIQYALSRSVISGEISWEDLVLLCRRGVALAKDQGRLAEALEILRVLEPFAESRGDRRFLDECATERIWILEEWGRTEEAAKLALRRQTCYADQMSFEF